MKYLGGIFMTTLNCCSTNCVKNKHGTCKAHEINVNGQGAHFSSDTECNGFNNSKLRSTLNIFDNIVPLFFLYFNFVMHILYYSALNHYLLI